MNSPKSWDGEFIPTKARQDTLMHQRLSSSVFLGMHDCLEGCFNLVCVCLFLLSHFRGWWRMMFQSCVCVCFRRAILGTCWMRKMILPQIVVNVRQDISETRDWLEDNPSSQGSQIWVLAKRVSNLPRCLKERQRKVCSLNPNDIQSLLEQQRMQLRQEGVEATGKDQVLLLSARCTARGTAHGPYMASPVGWNSANLLSLS